MATIGPKDLTPFLMTWKQRKELRMLLARSFGKAEKVASQLAEAATVDSYGESLAQLSLSRPECCEALLLWAYKDELTQDILDAVTKPSEVYIAAAEFMAHNADPEEEAAAKKAGGLLGTLSR